MILLSLSNVNIFIAVGFRFFLLKEQFKHVGDKPQPIGIVFYRHHPIQYIKKETILIYFCRTCLETTPVRWFRS